MQHGREAREAVAGDEEDGGGARRGERQQVAVLGHEGVAEIATRESSKGEPQQIAPHEGAQIAEKQRTT